MLYRVIHVVVLTMARKMSIVSSGFVGNLSFVLSIFKETCNECGNRISGSVR